MSNKLSLCKMLRLPVRFATKLFFYKLVYPTIYRRHAKQPIDERRVLFVELRHKEISNSMARIQNYLRDNTDCVISECCLRFASVPLRQFVKNCIALTKAAATAKYIITTDRSRELSCLPLRDETVVMQVWHGCGAFKKFGRSVADSEYGLSSREIKRFPLYRHYDYITVSSPEVRWAYEEAFGVGIDNDAEVVATGISRTDVFFEESYRTGASEKFYRTVPQARNKKIVLYAPTFRGFSGQAEAPDALDLEYLHERLGDEYFIAVKHHPCIKKRPDVPEHLRSFACDVTDSMTIDDMLWVSDICVSDYSSLVFEYSLFERPMIFFAYDIEQYDGLRGFYYPFEEFTPGPIVKTNEQLADHVLDSDNFDRRRIIDFREKFMASCDGHATERIVSLMLGEDKDKRIVPKF
ncbi:MAG: CDP-glycerol glycerophosphotransferase family protein [Clostridia bacterium]|nr:CDP-glycerol glycerophosphotransferase family protein [Clostridia bacterium]